METCVSSSSFDMGRAHEKETVSPLSRRGKSRHVQMSTLLQAALRAARRGTKQGSPSRKSEKGFPGDVATEWSLKAAEIRTPINRIPIMAKQILDLYMLYKLVTEKGDLVEIINKKIWREITKGLNLPTSITSAAFTLRTQYMKYLYAYECEKKALSSPAELQAAIDGNRREGRRPSYSSSLFGYSPAAATAAAAAGAPALLSPPKIRFPILGLGSSSGTNTSSPRISPAATLRKGDGAPVTTVPVPNRLAVPVTLASQQAGPRTATLEQLREQLESGESAEKKASRLSEEEQRLVQQAFQRNFFSMARQLPMKIRINGRGEPGSGQVFPFLLSAKPQPIHASWDWWGRVVTWKRPLQVLPSRPPEDRH
ncbi:AT-rich interactive domain-containing protein 3B [Saguinus oedipus]|uniref:AT-rich interactive domain-containing protein 3 n=1 Tax=Saguinus oedipus TaxID=9490 RepID=A0ABQ9V2U4_SAGOE|nr:AT-rich interactive domain-containing protein 3B [Saguinus oedipus]